jgi:NAD-dependent dihydropyrimidine dehydrogenase PreA subunit
MDLPRIEKDADMNALITSLKLDLGKCTGCGLCQEVCPHAVFVLENRKARIHLPQACMECGACQRNCAAGAIQVDTGVGCAAALISGALKGTEPECGCSSNPSNNCGCG